MSRRNATAAACAGAFAALAVLVADGRLTSIDQWAIDHAMPGAHFTAAKPTLVGAIVPLWHVYWSPALHAVADVVTLPAGILLATLVVALACLRLRGRAAVALAAAYVIGNAVEELTKTALTRPALHHGALHLLAYDNSYPSGHTIRTVLVAATVAAAWPRARGWAAAWAVCSVAMIELAGLHVPSDIAGGLLLAVALLATTSAWTRTRPSAASRPSSRAR